MMTNRGRWRRVALVGGLGALLAVGAGCVPERLLTIGTGTQGTISMTPVSLSVPVGGSAKLTVVVLDSLQKVDTGRRVTFSVSDSLVGRVTADGTLSALRVGLTLVTAVSDRGPTATSVVTVTALP